MTDDIARLARLQALEEAAALVERVGDRDDTSDIGEAASEAFLDEIRAAIRAVRARR